MEPCFPNKMYNLLEFSKCINALRISFAPFDKDCDYPKLFRDLLNAIMILLNFKLKHVTYLPEENHLCFYLESLYNL